MTGTLVGTPWLWAGFVALVLALLVLDLGLFHRRDQVIHAGQALAWSAFWIGLALVFDLGVWVEFGAEKWGEFLAGFLVEKSLSVDNLFVFVLIFSTLGIPPQYQHRVLFWGILTALVLRGAMILGGLALLNRYHWLIFFFGAFLVYSGIKLLFNKGGPRQPEQSRLFGLVARILPSTPEFHGHDFFSRKKGGIVATPLLVALLTIEFADVAFAVDSIPAVFGVTRDPFIVFTSNIFAILGLRSLYFVLADLVNRFVHLKSGVSAVLVFVGVKMLMADKIKISSLVSLSVILTFLSAAIAVSLLRTKKK
jgi:tellurite resistance protein TerC